MQSFRILGRSLVIGVVAVLWAAGCAGQSPSTTKQVEWVPSRLGAPPSGLAASSRPASLMSAPGKFSLRFYEKLHAHPIIAPLAAVDLWELRDHPRRYDIITVAPVPVSDYSGSKELLNQLATTHGLTTDTAELLTNWVKSGGVMWVEFGIFIQGHEWIRRPPKETVPAPDLAGFTIFGLRTRTVAFEARRTGAFAIEPVVFTIKNDTGHPAMSDIKTLKVVQSELRTYFPIIDPTAQGDALAREGDQLYASVASLGRGKIISTVPFDSSDRESDGEKYRINLVEWLGGYPVPTFDPRLDVDRLKD